MIAHTVSRLVGCQSLHSSHVLRIQFLGPCKAEPCLCCIPCSHKLRAGQGLQLLFGHRHTSSTSGLPASVTEVLQHRSSAPAMLAVLCVRAQEGCALICVLHCHSASHRV